MLKLKKITMLAIGLAFVSSAYANAKVLSKAQQTQMKQLAKISSQSDLSYQLVESLTTEVGARLVGSAGDKKSIVWAENKMRTLGFDKVWSEDVDAKFWQRGMAQAEIVAPFPQKLVAIALGGSISTAKTGIEAEIVHFENLAALQAVSDNSLQGKIAFISNRMQRAVSGKGYSQAVPARVNGAIVAAQKGASALLIRSIGTDDNRIAHTGSMYYLEGVKKIPAASLSNPDADMIINQLARGKGVTIHLTLTNSEEEKTVRTANVIGEITGSEFPEQVVAIGAHLDSWDVGTGAVDDGMGVGIVMAAAHHIAQLPQRPKRTIRVILFAAEEIGLVGAKQYLQAHRDDLDNHVIGAEWDFGTGKIYQMASGVGKNAYSAVEELASYLQPLGVKLSPENNAQAQSDMSVLSKAGMPAMKFLPDGSDYFDYHHTENDTLDKVEPEVLKQATAVYTLFSYFAANSGVDFRK